MKWKKIKYFGFRHPKLLKMIALGAFTLAVAFILLVINALPVNLPAIQQKTSDSETIKWVDFDVPYSLLEKTMYMDIETYETENHLNWIELLAYLGAKYGGNFKNYKEKDLKALVERLNQGEPIEIIAKDLKLYNYYKEAYTAVLGGFLGEFMIQVPVDSKEQGNAINSENAETNESGTETDGNVMWQSKYGLKAFSPIAQGYWYNDFDDFGAGRSYGYNRKHFGHDLMIGIGTPIIAVESGIVEATGWNQYGGWRIGIRSFDKKRYYYYAHLRKDRPYAADLYVGKAVKAGDVIGYSGRTGYSVKENVNNIDTPHLHIGMQLIFDESLKDSPNQIWVDMYAITRLLSKNKSPVFQSEETKEYYRKYQFSEPSYYLENNPDKESKEKASAALLASAAPEGSIPLPIIMYHGIMKNNSINSKFFVSEKTFENDLKYLQENHYTPIHIKDLIHYVDQGTPLPEHPVIITFDDGYYNNYLYAYPLLKKYNMKAVISIIGNVTDKSSEINDNNAQYSYLTWDQLREMADSGLIEIQNHTYDMHENNGRGRQGSLKKQGESEEDYAQALQADVGMLQSKITEMTGQTPTAFTYPFGFVKDNSKSILLEDIGFRATLTCYERINYVTRDPDSLYRLKRILRPPGSSSEEFFRTIAPAHTLP
ncbi:polysaccharide deacetylase family protein [Sinanaerobacter chloroacetimidivorans]|uniref:polysaccharide deacetylase family protein n=1 Tax=Sinanaerobacter chloroacetimidivorans TaxID=2818044 RepID=UPI001D03F52C|nr:polysaccharide deacetylase family protein [Sinanaerobacter chloroacetimidivorans]